MRVAVFQSNLRVGGIQKSLLNHLKTLSYREGFFVDVFVFDTRKPFFNLPRAGNIRYFFAKDLPYMIRLCPFELAAALFRERIKELLKKAYGGDLPHYDIAIDYDSYQNSCAIAALATDASRRVCWVHNDVEKKLRTEPKYRVLHFFFRSKYRYYDSFAMVSKGVAAPFYRVNPFAARRHRVVPNVVDASEIRELAARGRKEIKPSSAVNIVSVGRLCAQKGYDRELSLIKEISLEKNSDEIHFTIIGDGPDKKRLMKKVKTLGIEEYVTFTGNLENPYPVMAASDAFLTCSLYEGNPIAVREALALGLKVIMPARLEPYVPGIKVSKGTEPFDSFIIAEDDRTDI